MYTAVVSLTKEANHYLMVSGEPGTMVKYTPCMRGQCEGECGGLFFKFEEKPKDFYIYPDPNYSNLKTALKIIRPTTKGCLQ